MATPIDTSEPAIVYERLRRHLLELLSQLDEEQLALAVPATPAWTVKDVLAHVVGITVDLNAGDLGGAELDPEAWTRRQVALRRERSVEELAGEWDGSAPTFEEGLRLFGDEIGAHYVGDLAQHVLDVRSALGLPAAIDPEALRLGLDFYLSDLHDRLCAREMGVELSIDGRNVVAGARPPAARITLSALEAFRALGGRRSLGQLAALDPDGSAAAVIPFLSAYPPPAVDLVDVPPAACADV